MNESQIVANVKAFLKHRRESSGGWAEVKEGDMEDLQTILFQLIAAKFERDPDGDLPVEFILVDRTKTERVHVEPVPYDHKPPTEEQREKAFEAIMFNLSIATERANGALRMRRYHREEAKRKKEKQ